MTQYVAECLTGSWQNPSQCSVYGHLVAVFDNPADQAHWVIGHVGLGHDVEMHTRPTPPRYDYPEEPFPL